MATTATIDRTEPVPHGRAFSALGLVLVPALITLGVTGLRLAGELLDWSPRFFSREPGGAGALVGIVWLVPVFGAWFGHRLVRMGRPPARAWAAVGYAVAGFALLPLSFAASSALKLGSPWGFLVIAAAAIGAMLVACRGWRDLGRVLFAYGMAARIPVAILMLVAMLNNWGTHYEKGPPGLPEMGMVPLWFWIGLMPQLTFWVAFTMTVGGIFGGIAAAIAMRRKPPSAI
ncbi:MAG TPA: hypothetical protein VFM29_07630 [Vicinamibacteria bacterium]|nr:hypothetical protein [Vicinamibacteria bacterium]